MFDTYTHTDTHNDLWSEVGSLQTIVCENVSMHTQKLYVLAKEKIEKKKEEKNRTLTHSITIQFGIM